MRRMSLLAISRAIAIDIRKFKGYPFGDNGDVVDGCT